MITLNAIQGSPEWHAHRAQSLNASDAPAMMNSSGYKSRADLVRQMATGVTPEIGPDQQRRLDNGHRLEALARPLAEQILGEELFPVVGYIELGAPCGHRRLSASFDGLTIGEDVGFEHKQLNDTLRAAMQPGCTGADLPLMYRVQMQQQMAVAGCERILFMASDWDAEGNLIEERHCFYENDIALHQQIMQGWCMLLEDVKNYQPSEEVVTTPIVAKRPDNLPALLIEVQGSVVRSNLEPFKRHALEVIDGINTTLESDQDFADAEATIKWLRDDVAAQLKTAKQHAMAQMGDIDALYRAVDEVIAAADGKRLQLDKLVKARKDEIRAAIITAAQAALDEHVKALNQRLGKPWLNRFMGAFAEAVKGKKTRATLQDAADAELARCKIESNALADRLQVNAASLSNADGRDWMFLFADFAVVGLKPAEDFAAIASQRIQQHQQAEEEAKARAAAAEQARQQAEASKAAQAAEPAPVAQPMSAPAPQPVPQSHPAQTTPSLTVSQINARLGFVVTADFLQALGFEATQQGAKKLYSPEQFPAICQAIARHVTRIAQAGGQA